MQCRRVRFWVWVSLWPPLRLTDKRKLWDVWIKTGAFLIHRVKADSSFSLELSLATKMVLLQSYRWSHRTEFLTNRKRWRNHTFQDAVCTFPHDSYTEANRARSGNNAIADLLSDSPLFFISVVYSAPRFFHWRCQYCLHGHSSGNLEHWNTKAFNKKKKKNCVGKFCLGDSQGKELGILRKIISQMMDVFLKAEQVMYPCNNKQVQTVWNITTWFRIAK